MQSAFRIKTLLSLFQNEGSQNTDKVKEWGGTVLIGKEQGFRASHIPTRLPNRQLHTSNS